MSVLYKCDRCSETKEEMATFSVNITPPSEDAEDAYRNRYNADGTLREYSKTGHLCKQCVKDTRNHFEKPISREVPNNVRS